MTEFVLEVLEGDHAGEVLPLDPGGLKMGRKASNRLVLKDEKVSGEHAAVVFEDGRYVLRDLGSTNGTLIDGHKITEVPLSPGDEFLVGRVRIRFRAADGAGQAPAGGGGDDLKVHKLGQGALARARKRGGGTLALVVLLLAVAGGAGFLFLRTRGEGGPVAAGGSRAPLLIEGNQLAADVAQCEHAEKWELGAAGGTFEPGGPGRSSRGALEATRGEGAHPGFALARVARDGMVRVRAGQTIKLVGHVRTEGGGLGAVRLRAASTAEGERGAAGAAEDGRGTTVLVAGTVPVASDGFQEVSATLVVPTGVEVAQVEALALLPANGARVWIDDVGVVDAGAAGAATATVAGASLLQFDTAAALVVANDDPVIVAVRPAPAGAAAPLAEAGLAALSDAGLELAVQAQEDGFAVAVKPRERGTAAAGVVLELSRDVASGVSVRTPEGFLPQAGAFSVPAASELLFGSGPARLVVRLPAPMTVTGKGAGEVFRITLSGGGDELAMLWLRKWAKQRDDAAELLRAARAATTPAEALQATGKLLRELPYDEDSLRAAQELRTEKLAAGTTRTEDLRAEANKVRFFSSRIGDGRLRAALDQLQKDYGDQLPDAAAVQALREEVDARLRDMDESLRAEASTSLAALAERLEKVAQPGLAQLVRDHLKGK